MGRMRSATTGLALAATVAAVLCAPAQADQVVSLPSVDSAPAGGCALREAIETLRTNTEVDSCVLTPTAGGDEVLLVTFMATYPIAIAGNNDDVNASGDFDIRENLTITGAGAALSTIDGNALDRVFDVQSGATLTLRDLTVTDGKAPNGTANTGAAGGKGGGIRATGELVLDRVVVTANTAGNGGSGANGTPGQAGGQGGDGGGVYSFLSVTVTDSVISNNFAGNGASGGSASGACSSATSGGTGGFGGSGGGIAADNSGAVISGSTITGNLGGLGGDGGCAATPGFGGNAGSGGGISASSLTLTNSTVSDNQTRNGGLAGSDGDTANTTASGRGGDGGGIRAYSGATISGSTISGNVTGAGRGNAPGTTGNAGGSQGGDGGGALLGGAGSVTNSTFSGNHTGNGAASATLHGNQGGTGGGIAITDSDFIPGTGYVISRSTFSDNFTGVGGNSPTNPGPGGAGGAIYVGNTNAVRTVAVSDSTLTGNSTGVGGNHTGGGTGAAGGRGGAVGVGDNGAIGLTHLTIADNTTGTGGTGGAAGAQPDGGAIDMSSPFVASTVTVKNSILASNVPATCAVSNATLTDGGRNLVFGTQCTDITAFSTADPLLAALADNGGSTQTRAIGDASPARDAVPATGAGCTATDQRNTTRPQGSACDAGAFEIFVPPPPPPPDTGDGGGGTPTDPATTEQAPGTTAPPAAPAADRTAPVVRLALTRQRLLRALRKGYFAFFFDNELGTAVASLFASGRDARGTAAARRRVARGTLRVTRTGKQKLVLKFTRKAKRAFRTRRKVTLSLVLVVKDAAGNPTRKTAKVVLRR